MKNALFDGDLKEEVYMDAPSSFDGRFGLKVCKLKKSLHGLKQSQGLGSRSSLNLLKVKGMLRNTLIILCKTLTRWEDSCVTYVYR